MNMNLCNRSMKPLNDNIKCELAKRFGLNPEDLVFLAGGREDSDGIVFLVNSDGKKECLRYLRHLMSLL